MKKETIVAYRYRNIGEYRFRYLIYTHTCDRYLCIMIFIYI